MPHPTKLVTKFEKMYHSTWDKAATEAPAPLDVEALAEAMGSMKWSWLGWVDGEVTEPLSKRRGAALHNAASALAAEYARLTARAAATEDQP